MTLQKEFSHILSNQEAKAIGTVGVLYGGISHEREVSLWSGKAIYDALTAAGINATLIDVEKDFIQKLPNLTIDFAFIALHGRGGEDGSVQAMLEWCDIPYVGSGLLASAIAMDKVKTKELWKSHDLPVLPQQILHEGFDIEKLIENIGLPMAIKPALEGSSNGISKVCSREEVLPAFTLAQQHNSTIMAEQWVEGKEYTGAFIGKQALPLIGIEVEDGIYDFNTKYVTGASNYRCPCDLPKEQEASLQNLVLKAADTLNIKDWGRVDIMIDKDNQPWLIEINTIPGMTETSLVPKAAKALGLSFTETVLTILATSWRDAHA